MRILITIPHYYKYNPQGQYGSSKDIAEVRARALANTLFNIQSNFGTSQFVMQIKDRTAIGANKKGINKIDIIVCTTGNNHLLSEMGLSNEHYKYRNVNVENPRMLVFECHKVLKENLGKYDYYCYMEDDLIINDTSFFDKLIWFNKEFGNECVLQPNRYESSSRGRYLKLYVDGDIVPRATEKYQNIDENSSLQGHFLGKEIEFKRPLNPHSGCFFLTKDQMTYWANQDYYLDMDCGFISPLESGASLGIMKTFKIYKPTPQNANFLEIQHFGDYFLRNIPLKIL